MIQKKRYRGELKFYSYKRGFGFLICDDPGVNEDVFFHFTSIAKQKDMKLYLLPNEILEFDLVKGPNGLLAKNVSSPNYKMQKNKNDRLDIFRYYHDSFRKMLEQFLQRENLAKHK